MSTEVKTKSAPSRIPWNKGRLVGQKLPPRSAVRLIGPLTVLATWEVAARFGPVNTLLFPPPSKALADLVVLASSGYLWKALYASLFRVVCGFAIAVVVGLRLARRWHASA
jgi:ABC-type nitrate/sulfonate/bicarbonate transport system permease component